MFNLSKIDFSSVRLFLKQCFTEADNQTGDLGRILWAVGVVIFLFISIWYYCVANHAFDPMLWGTGFGAVLGAGAGTIWLKSLEKDNNNQDKK